VFNANAPSYRATQVSSLYDTNDLSMRNNGNNYMINIIIREVEMGSFTPLEFSKFGSMGCTAAVFCKKLVYLVSIQKWLSYGSVIFIAAL